MAMTQWLYRKADGIFLAGGFQEMRNPDATVYGVAEFQDADQPDPALHRHDASLGKRLMTQAESDAAAADRLDAIAGATSHQKDLLATVALIEKRTNPNWASLTLAQKRTAVLAAADEWKALRVQVDKFL